MIGTIINGVCIILGGIIGVVAANLVGKRAQIFIKMLLAAATLYVATEMIFKGLGGGFLKCLGQFGIAMLSLILGNAIGMGLGIQKQLNKLGQYAKEKMSKGAAGDDRFNEGFITCTILFCVGPMSIIGSIEDGLAGNYKILAIKGAMDGIATIGFTAMFGWGSAVAVVPVVAYQGTITICAGALEPILNEAMFDSIRVTGGLMVYCIVVVILEIRKVPLANYLPALVVAPPLTKWWM